MYCEHFGLTHFPFANRVDLHGLFQSPSFEKTCEEVLSNVADGACVQLVVGEPGSGKSTVLARLREALRESDLHAVSVSYTMLTVRELLSFIGNALPDAPGAGEPDDEDSTVPHPLRLAPRLAALSRAGTGVVILVDDAEALGDDMLEALPGLLSDGAGEPLAQLVLAVGPTFAQSLTGPELTSLNATIHHVCHLQPWDRATVVDYVCAAVELSAGSAGELFTPDAFDAIVERSGGVPARVNRICMAAMVTAYERDETRVTGAAVRAARIALEDSPSETNPNLVLDVDEEPEFADEAGAFDLGAAELRYDDPLAPRRDGLALRARLAALGDRFAGQRLRRLALPAGVAASALLAVLVGVSLWSSAGSSPDPAAASDSTGDGRAFTSRIRIPEPPRDELREALGESLTKLGGTLKLMEARIAAFETELSELREAVAKAKAPPGPDRGPAISARSSGAASAFAAAAQKPAPAAEPAKRQPSPTPIARAEPAAPEPPAALRVERIEAAGASSRAPGPVAERAGYEVMAGDTLWSIARRFDMTAGQLARRNGLDERSVLKPRQRLQIAPLATTAGTPNDGRWYTVKRGDSLYTIGRRFSLPVPVLADWNCLGSAEVIRVGQRLSLEERDGSQCASARG